MTEAETNREFDELCKARGVERQDMEELFDLVASDVDEQLLLFVIGTYPKAARALLYKCIVPPRSITDRSESGD